MKLADARLLILGRNPTEEIFAAAQGDERIEVVGFVHELGDYFNRYRLSVAPMRTGAGIKGKIVTSASYGVPCVATTLAAECMGLTAGREILVADGAERFAEAVVRLYSDESFWYKVSDRALEFMEEHFSCAAGKERLREFLAFLLPASNKRYRIVVEVPSFNKGGLEKVVLDSVLAFDKALFECVIVTPGALGHLSAMAESAGITVVQLPQIKSGVAYKRFLKKFNPQLSLFNAGISNF